MRSKKPKLKKDAVRWVLQIEELTPGNFEYTRLYDREKIPDEHWDEAMALISKVSKKTIIKIDIRDVLSHKTCEIEKGEIPPYLTCYVWSKEERAWTPLSRILWVPLPIFP
jgi:hypothetical protein